MKPVITFFKWIGDFITACEEYLEYKILTGKFIGDLTNPKTKLQPTLDKKTTSEADTPPQAAETKPPVSLATQLWKKLLRFSLFENFVFLLLSSVRIVSVYYVDIVIIFILTLPFVLVLFNFFETSLMLFFIMLLPFSLIIVFCLSAFYSALEKKMAGEEVSLWQSFVILASRFLPLSLPLLTQVAVALVSSISVFLISFLFTYLYDLVKIPWQNAFSYWLVVMSLCSIVVIGLFIMSMIMGQAYFAILFQKVSFQKALKIGLGKIQDHPFQFFFFYTLCYLTYMLFAWRMTLSYQYLGLTLSIFFMGILGLFLGYLLERKFPPVLMADLQAEKSNKKIQYAFYSILAIDFISYCLVGMFVIKQHDAIFTFFQQENFRSAEAVSQYTNNAYRYSIAYPQNWTVYERKNNTVTFYNNYTGNIKDGIWFSVTIKRYNEAFFANIANARPGIVTLDPSSKAIMTKVSNSTVQGSDTVTYTYVNPGESYTQYETHYLIHKGDYQYEVVFVSLSNNISGYTNDFFDKIVATLKFID